MNQSSIRTKAHGDAAPAHGLPMTAADDGIVGAIDIDFTRLFYMLFMTLDTQVSLSDTKAQVILGVNAIMLTAIPANFGAAARIAAGSTAWIDYAVVLMTLLMLVAVIMSVLAAVNSLRPSLIAPTNQPNMFFFGHIAQLDQQAFIDRFMAMRMSDVKANIIAQIHTRSVVVTRKYTAVRNSIRFLLLGLLLFAFSRALLALGGV
jgi:hypothetical protein